MAATLRDRERALVAERERNLRNEQIIGVANLAAGTAHELSTPLATIAVIAAELESQTDGAARDELGVLLDQVGVCRAALERLRASASPTPEALRADVLLAQLRERFELLSPTTHLVWEIGPADAAPTLNVETALRQALLNLLDNAAAVSETVELVGRWDGASVRIDILDRGPGLIGAEAGDGMGTGLLLANSSIERAGGSVRAMARSGGGTCIRVREADSLAAARQAAGQAPPALAVVDLKLPDGLRQHRHGGGSGEARREQLPRQARDRRRDPARPRGAANVGRAHRCRAAFRGSPGVGAHPAGPGRRRRQHLGFRPGAAHAPAHPAAQARETSSPRLSSTP